MLPCVQAAADTSGPNANMRASPLGADAPGLPHMSANCLSWFAARKISPATLLRNQVTEQYLHMSRKHPEKAHAVVFPYLQNREVVGRKMRTLGRRFSHDMPSRRIWYGLDDIVDQDTIIIVEGDYSL